MAGCMVCEDVYGHIECYGYQEVYERDKEMWDMLLFVCIGCSGSNAQQRPIPYTQSQPHNMQPVQGRQYKQQYYTSIVIGDDDDDDADDVEDDIKGDGDGEDVPNGDDDAKMHELPVEITKQLPLPITISNTPPTIDETTPPPPPPRHPHGYQQGYLSSVVGGGAPFISN